MINIFNKYTSKYNNYSNNYSGVSFTFKAFHNFGDRIQGQIQIVKVRIHMQMQLNLLLD